MVGRPNTGKSTLTNALVGQKVAIASSRPQTTRHTVRGIVNTEEAQLVLVDTPGLHRPRTLLGERLNELVRATLAEVDVVAVCLPADERVGPGDRYLVGEVAKIRRKPTLAVVTKADLVDPGRMLRHLESVAGLAGEVGLEWDEVVPVSAIHAGRVIETRASGATADGDGGAGGDPDDDGDPGQVRLLRDLLIERLPEGPRLYPDEELSDEPEEVLIAELIREAALEGVRDELPHSIAVVVEEMAMRPDRPEDRPLLDVYANIYLERQSQKPIVLGPKGARMRDVGSRARKQIETILGTPVYLDLHVKIAKDWQRDPKQLRRLGF